MFFSSKTRNVRTDILQIFPHSAAFTARAASWPTAQVSGNRRRRRTWHSDRSTETEYQRNWTACLRQFVQKCCALGRKWNRCSNRRCTAARG